MNCAFCEETATHTHTPAEVAEAIRADTTTEELVAALLRMYRRSRAAGVLEEDAVEGVLRRALP